jgi:hypothetical protein
MTAQEVDAALPFEATLADWKMTSSAQKLATTYYWTKLLENRGVHLLRPNQFADSVAHLIDQDIERAIDELGPHYSLYEYGSRVVVRLGLALTGNRISDKPTPERNIDRIGRRACLVWMLAPGLLIIGLLQGSRAWSLYCRQQAAQGFPAADSLFGRILYSFCPRR